MTQLQGAIAATRFGMGARPGEIKDAASDPRGWLKAQIAPEAAIMPAGDLLSARDVLQARQEAYGMNGAAAKGPDGVRTEARQAIQKQVQREIRDGLQEEIEARSRHAATTPNSFAERWHRFWANHFTVAARNAQTVGLAGPFEREAIRPNVFGRFSTLLGAATFHPGMLVYLDAARSFGPSTQVAERRKAGLNENLAREILELHTMGVGSGYTQADIIEFAKALTGWTVASPQTARLASLSQAQRAKGSQQRARQQASAKFASEVGETAFLDALHEPGARKVLAKTYAGPAAEQAGAILNDLAVNPATAKHIATKLTRHFVSDTPPASAIARLESVFIRSGGDLSTLARAVIDLDEAWGETSQKFKTPEELLVSAARAAGVQAAFGGGQRAVYASLAQQPFGASSPAGWPDDTASWAGSDAIKKRLEWANSVSRRMARGETPTQFLDRALGEIASEKTRQAVARAESAEQGFTLALMSPEFQRR